MQWVSTQVQHLPKQNGKRRKALQWDRTEGTRNVSFFHVQQIPGHLCVVLTTYKCKTYHVVLLGIAHTLYFTFFTSDKMSSRQFDDHWTSNRILAFTWWSGSRMIRYSGYLIPVIGVSSLWIWNLQVWRRWIKWTKAFSTKNDIQIKQRKRGRPKRIKTSTS